MFKIESVVEVHSSDIKDVFLGPETRVTCSRDAKIKVLHKNERYTLCPCHGYVNCLAVTPSLGIYAGCQDGTIVFYPSFDAEPVYIAGHKANICALDYHRKLLSGSWDHVLNEWDGEVPVFSFLHPGPVWSCRYISETSFATACTDTKIRIFDSGVLKVEMQHHLHCVRSLWIHKDIYSVSNEGMFIQNTLDGGLVKYASHDSLMYSVYVDDKYTVLAGDNGRIAVNGKIMKFPVQTFWKAVVFEGKVYAAGSDGKLYVLTEDERLEEGEEAQDTLFEKPEEERCQKSGAKDGYEDGFQGHKKKVVNGKVYMLVNNEWILFGDVVKSFDHTFSVDVEGKSLQLSFNDDEDVFDVADRFIKQHKLNEQYKDEIVEFINKNFKKKRPYHVYKKVNYEGVEKILSKYQSSAILENLKSPQPENSEGVEQNIKSLMGIEERFVLLDCYRYFVAMGFQFDFVFLTKFIPRDRKEALVFIKLVTNLYPSQPFNLECLRDQIIRIKDERIVSTDIFDKYEGNREISKE